MFSLLLALAVPSSGVPAVEHIAAQEAAKRVSQCGLGPVTTHYVQQFEEEVLVASSAKSATDDQLACAYQVVGFYFTLELPSNVQPRFDAMLGAKADVLMKAQAHEWLSARGLLNRVPKYQKGITDDGEFARQVEVLCGPQPKGAFQSKYGLHALNPDWVSRQLSPPGRGDEALFHPFRTLGSSD